jgi:chaperonin cofactor prefoldin
MTALENQIESMKRKMEVCDDRIGRLMSQRVELEEKLARLYAKRNKNAEAA